ncbi:MAG: ribonuclease HII [Victivallaceae bacterium]|nr:ribonuclease HII [Victivallaceae bacterium]
MNFDSDLLEFERRKYDQSFRFVAGVDEAGRGPLAGPVVAAAVVLPREGTTVTELPDVFDSKQLSAARREVLYAQLCELPGIRFGIGSASVEEIDRINILQATYLAMRRALAQVECCDFILVDGNRVPGLPAPSLSIVKGDAQSASIAAASILAKVTRDHQMMELDRQYPHYGFCRHMGYATAEHLAALKQYGVCPAHRRSFAPVREIVHPSPVEQMELKL